ncbi:MAG: class I SAM-dependent methyltransferase [Chloroflexi bacterium]|nr:MAG: class I SAM-dependent methyltransferase [Chloroflexota bacterium]
MTDPNHWQQDNPEWNQNRASFDKVAELYDAYRPSYPNELVQFVISTSRLPANGQILEIGCGTGTATRLFAARGYTMVCVEPGANLAALAQKRLKENKKVSFEVSRFEDWHEDNRRFDLVLSAQAFHWVPVEVAYTKSARILEPAGCLALVWNMYPDLHGPVWEEMQSIYAKYWPGSTGEPISYLELADRRTQEIIESGCFLPPQIGIFPWLKTYTTEQYLGLLSTYSDHITLDPELREKLFVAIAKLIDSHGGQVERTYVAYAYVAQRL